MRGRWLAGVALAVLIALAAGVASASEFVVPIPGLRAGFMRAAGALRTNDGGGVLAVRVSAGPRARRGRLVLARLEADGALVLSYGTEGLSAIPVDPSFEPTALAVDPGTGEAWVGGRVGLLGEIVAVDGSGRRVAGFGRHGVLQLGRADRGGPVAIAWRSGALLVAAGASGCRGCSLSLRDPRSGRLLRSASLGAAGGCVPGGVTGAVFAAGARELISTRAAAGCPAGALAFDRRLQPVGSSPLPVRAAARSVVVAGDAGAACVAALASARGGWVIAPAGSGTGMAAPGGAIVSLVPLGSGACAALLSAPGRAAVVAQTGAGGRRAATDAVPRSLAPLAMFRCHSHLLVVATQASGRSRQGVIYPVAVRRGRFAAAAARGTGCAAAARRAALPLPGPGPAPTSLTVGKTLGWVSAKVSGQAGSSVELAEIVGGRSEPIETVTLPSSGQLDVPHLAIWLCQRRARTFSADSSSGNGSGAPAQASVRTPSCRHRLRLGSTPRTARVGRRLAVSVSDRWRVGGVRFALCVAAPVSRRSCRTVALAAGRRGVTERVSLGSPGSWRLSVGTAYGQHLDRAVSVEHPGGRLSMLATGDSEIQEVDSDLAAALGPRGVRVTSDARVGTGISKVAQFDWVRHAEAQVAGLRPDVTVVFIGANDGFSLHDRSGAYVACCGPQWIRLFAARAKRMMAAYRRGGRGRVFWFTLPIARDARYAALFRAVNEAYVEAASAFHGDGVELIRADRIFTPGGRYRQSMDYHGRTVDVRAPDGIHLSPAGAQIAAAAVVSAMRSGRVIR